jgi:hypothetical protein
MALKNSNVPLIFQSTLLPVYHCAAILTVHTKNFFRTTSIKITSSLTAVTGWSAQGIIHAARSL